MTRPQKVLILCTGNSCRSQMAEVIWRNQGLEHWIVDSAGSNPSGFVHPMAIQALQELGLPTNGLISKSVEQFATDTIDLVITVCDHAKESCPLFPGAKETLHWPFDDPADAEGTDEEKMIVFRRVRDQIRHAIENFLSQRSASSNRTDSS